MRIEEFLRKVASEPERTVTHSVWTTPTEVLAKMAKQGGMLLTDFLSVPGRRKEQRKYNYCHVLGPPASPSTIEAWQKQRPFHPLPADLLALVARINGIHLWADRETARSYIGFAPIEEWEIARIKMYGSEADRSLLDDRYIALSYALNGDAFIVVDATSGRYYLMDVSGPNEACPIGRSSEDLLDWFWENRFVPASDNDSR